jgi:hypothetical protein
MCGTADADQFRSTTGTAVLREYEDFGTHNRRRKRLAETEGQTSRDIWSATPCTKGGERLHRGLLSELPIVLGSDVLVGELG